MFVGLVGCGWEKQEGSGSGERDDGGKIEFQTEIGARDGFPGRFSQSC